jgi:hypothetical protein
MALGHFAVLAAGPEPVADDDGRQDPEDNPVDQWSFTPNDDGAALASPTAIGQVWPN